MTALPAMRAAAREVERRMQIPEAVAEAVERTVALEELGAGELGVAIRAEALGIAVYLLSGDVRTDRDADELARSFVWPSFAKARRPSAHLAAGDAFADEVTSIAHGGVTVLIAREPEAQRFLRAVADLLRVRARRPPTVVTSPRNVGVVLRDFEDAVAREDVATARALLDEAWATGRLSLVNRSLLETRVLAATRAWPDVLEHVAAHRLADIHVPAPVEHDIVRGVWFVSLEDAFRGGLDAATEAFSRHVGPEVGGAFRDHRRAASPEARLAWIIRYIAIGNLPPEAFEDIVNRAPAGEQRHLRELTAHLRGPDSPVEETVRHLLEAGENAAAWAVAEPSTQLAVEVRNDALSRAAARLDDPVREAAAAAAATAGDPPMAATVGDWRSWLSAVFDDPEWADATRVLDANAEVWTEQAIAAGDALGDVSATVETLAGEPTLRRAAPHLARAATRATARSGDAAPHRPLLLALAYAIDTEPHPGLADLEALGDIAATLLLAGLDTNTYRELAARLERAYAKLSAPPLLARWVVEIAELLLTSPAPDERERGQAVRLLLGPLINDTRRARPLIRREVWIELSELLESHHDLVDLCEPVERASSAESEDDAFASLASRKVLLHTLVTAAAERAKRYLEGAANGVIVWIDDSSVASDRLRDRARQADMVVVAARAAKHAAFDCIQASTSTPLVYASGKGWSSLVSAVRDALDADA